MKHKNGEEADDSSPFIYNWGGILTSPAQEPPQAAIGLRHARLQAGTLNRSPRRKTSHPPAIKNPGTADAVPGFLVETEGFEPLTSRMRTERSPKWNTHSHIKLKGYNNMKTLEYQRKLTYSRCVSFIYVVTRFFTILHKPRHLSIAHHFCSADAAQPAAI